MVCGLAGKGGLAGEGGALALSGGGLAGKGTDCHRAGGASGVPPGPVTNL